MQYKLWNLSIDRKFDVIFPKNLMKFHVWIRSTSELFWPWRRQNFEFSIFFDRKHVCTDPVYNFDPDSFEISHQKHMFFGRNWTRVTSRRNLLLIRGQILYLNLAHVFNHVFLQKSPQRKISWLPKILKILSKIISSSI